MSGSSPQAQPVQLSPTIAPRPSPLYGFAKEMGNSFLPQLLNTPIPEYQGKLDPGLSPTMQHLMRGAQSYASSPFPKSLEQSAGTLGAFQNFDKMPGASYDYQFDPSHSAMYRFQQPAFQDPSQAQGPPPDYGFNVKPMAEGGAAGWGILDQPVEVDGYYYGPEGLTFNPNDGGGRLGDSRWGNIWEAIQGITGFQPGEQHGPNAQFWDAIPPAGLDYGRGGAIDPTDLKDPNATGYGWWSAEPGSGGMDMPPWLAGLNDEQMRYVFDLVGNIPPGMRQPSDYQGQRLAGEGLMDWGTSPSPSGGQGGGRRRGGGGGGGPKISFQGIPGYNPPQVDASFVEWDPSNPTPSMTAPQNLTPPAPDFFSPPPAPPVGAGGGGGGGGGMGGGGGRRPPQGPPPGGGGPGPGGLPPELLSFIQSLIQGGGQPPPGGGGPPMGAPSMMDGPRPGGQFQGIGGQTAPLGSTRNEAPGWHGAMYAEGSVVDHPQLAMIGEAGPEVVLPLSRPAADPRIQQMQQRLGLPVGGDMPHMAQGGAGGTGASRDLDSMFRPMPLPTRSPGGMTSITGGGYQVPPNQLANKPGMMSPGGGNTLTQLPMPMGGNQIRSGPFQQPSSDRMGGLLAGGRGAGSSSPPMMNPGAGAGGTSLQFQRTPTRPGGGSTPTMSPLPLPGGNQLDFQGGRPTPARPGTPTPASGFGDFGDQGRAQSAFDAWSGATGNRQGLSFEDWMKPSQANWFKDRWLQNNPMNPTPDPSTPSPTTSPPPTGGGPTMNPTPPPGAAPPPGGNQISSGPFPQTNGMPPPQGSQGGIGPSSIWDVYRSAVPVMNDIMGQQIQGAAAMGGATGNRFGTATERNFGEIGRQAGNDLTSMMSNLLYQQTQADQDRALQATGMGLEDSRFRNQLGFQGQQNAFDRALQAAGMGMGAAGMQDQMAQDRLRLPFQMGSWEQGRQDNFANTAFQDFQNSRLGWIPQILGLLGGQGGTGGMQGQWGVNQTAGSPGFMDYASAFAPYLGLFMARGGAAGHRAGKILDEEYY